MSDWPVYSRKQWIKAVNLSALLGYLSVVGVPSLLNANPGGIIGGAILGVPFAMLCCWVVGAPILKRVMQREISWISAACWGAAIAAILATLSIAIGRYSGWRQSNNPNFNSTIGGGDNVISIDGILTPYGWQVLAQDTLLFIFVGAVIAITVKWLVGKPAGFKTE
ncbi:hypothetical protein [uncultured Roseobacter sp.]|uniref:hypothetical protein n=1 Tax=uncultured Roseobacter sp. TaxID=114847 RepID=UPI00261465A1|nr:hypothetical protein [uncultured Roseobacter sp.]